LTYVSTHLEFLHHFLQPFPWCDDVATLLHQHRVNLQPQTASVAAQARTLPHCYSHEATMQAQPEMLLCLRIKCCTGGLQLVLVMLLLVSSRWSVHADNVCRPALCPLLSLMLSWNRCERWLSSRQHLLSFQMLLLLC
jgi:hypothetical protein